MLCTYRRTDLRPLVWNVAVCIACCSNNKNTHTHRCNVAVGCISLRHVVTPELNFSVILQEIVRKLHTRNALNKTFINCIVNIGEH